MPRRRGRAQPTPDPAPGGAPDGECLPRETGRARRELLAIQKKLWRRLQREIESSIDEDPPNIELYQEEFERDVRRYQAVATKDDLVRAAAEADIVYVGDYHTLPQAQRTVVKLLLALSRLRPEVVLLVEFVHTSAQPALDAYQARRLDEGQFLRQVDWARTWGFDWAPYREILEVARRRRVKVLGINSDPLDHQQDHMLERDFHAAQVVAAACREHPGALLLVFDGDFHVARDHLPLLVDTTLQRQGLPPRRRLIVHQNAEEIYWTLAGECREHAVNVVRLADDAWCVLNATPFEKLHSWLNWVSERDTLDPPEAASSWEISAVDTSSEEEPLPEGDEDDDEDFEDEDEDEELDDDDPADLDAEYAEQVHQIVRTIADFLGVARDDLDGFELHTVNDLEFLSELDRSGRFTPAEREDIKRQVLRDESYVIPKGDIIYLADFTVANAAEEATHFLHHRCAGYDWDRPRQLVTDFYFRCVTEALGFFGSKIIVPTRVAWTERDCQRFVLRERRRERERARRRERGGGKKKQKRAARAAAGAGTTSAEGLTVTRSRRMTLLASRLVLQHKEVERGWLESGAWSGAGKALTQPAEVHLLLTHMLGHMLGEALYQALIQGLVSKAEVRDLFHAPLDKRGVALRTYQDLVRRAAPFGGLARGERL